MYLNGRGLASTSEGSGFNLQHCKNKNRGPMEKGQEGTFMRHRPFDRHQTCRTSQLPVYDG